MSEYTGRGPTKARTYLPEDPSRRPPIASSCQGSPLTNSRPSESRHGQSAACPCAQAAVRIVVAAEDDELRDAARDLGGLGATVDAVLVDLSRPDGVEELWRRTQAHGRPLAAAALNAGVGAGGAFVETELEDELRLVDLNVRSTVHLAKHVVRDMVARDEGRILFTSSIASTMPGAFQAVYNASKSFVQSFGLALRNELSDTDVTVTLLMPGPTDTEFFERADMLDTKVGAGGKDDPADVARGGFEALMNGDERVVSASLTTKLQATGSRVLPDSVKAGMHRRMAEPGSAPSSPTPPDGT